MHIYHVNSHTYKKQKVFLAPEFEEFVKLAFHIAARKYQFDLMNCEVMPSHVHWLIKLDPEVISLAKAVQVLKGMASRELLARYPDLRHDLKGHLWNPGYNATTVLSEIQLKRTMEYITNQKVKGGLV